MPDTGTGTTIAFATSSWAAVVTDINFGGITRDEVDTTHLGTTGSETSIPTKLKKNGSIDLTAHFDPDALAPIAGAIETITMTFPLPAGQTTPADWEFSGYLTNVGPAIPLKGLMTQAVTIVITGPITETASA